MRTSFGIIFGAAFFIAIGVALIIVIPEHWFDCVSSGMIGATLFSAIYQWEYERDGLD